MLALRVNVEIDGVFAQGRNGALSAVPAALSFEPDPNSPCGRGLRGLRHSAGVFTLVWDMRARPY